MKRTWIREVRIVNEGTTFPGSVVMEDEEIAEVLAGPAALPAYPCDDVIVGI